MILQFNDTYRWLNNFAAVEVEFEGLRFNSVEHAYQAAKSSDIDWRLYCANEVDPDNVRKSVKLISIRPDWEYVKVSIMEKLLIQKFDQAPYADLLMATDNTYIINGNIWEDTFWGVDMGTGKGTNKLGHLIMKIRSAMKAVLVPQLV